MQEIRTADLDAIASQIVDAIASGRAPSPVEARFLLREYVATGRDDVRDALGLALAHVVAGADADAGNETATPARAARLMLLVEAAEIADDERVIATAGHLMHQLRAEWPIDLARAGLAAAAMSVDACLRASSLLDPAEIVQPAIDELERIVASAYRPGEGVKAEAAPSLGADGFAEARGDARRAEAGQASGTDHASVASALLTAFEITGRLSYSMLAEELMQSARDAAVDCDAALVLCRLAALHGNAEYRAAAVLAPGADYRAAAARILRDRAPQALAAQAADAALYGIALRELMSLR